ncbi:MAG: response regulator [Desulfobacterales bacterium]|nr:response regulator [Desulfobacterales bacterium]
MKHTQTNRIEQVDAVHALASGVAHDFNNLLTAIKGHATLMMNNISPSDPLHGNIFQIIQCIDKGSEVTNQLLGFARVGHFYPVAMDVNRLVRRAMGNLDLNGLRIVLDVDMDSKSLVVSADGDKIYQVVMAIVDNALQAMPHGGKLSVVTEEAPLLNGTARRYGLESGYFAKITVTDTGIGMDEEVLSKIFKPFYSADHADHPEKQGLGLTFAREIVQNHGGVIDVWSTPGAGSSFSIILPLADPVDISDTPSADEKLALGHESVLIVDDEQRILTVDQEICKALGYNVMTASSGKEALEIYAQEKSRIHLVILDMIMPQMNGFETFMELKKHNPDVKVLLSTGYSIDEKAQEMMNQGCKGFILKPYSVIDFSHKIREALE